MSASSNVRSLLRSERKARRIEHPHAIYNSSGVLACQLCHIQIKAESLWSQHIHGSHHRGQLQRLRAAQASQAVAAANATKLPAEQGATADVPNRKKRKADDDEDVDNEPEDARKKTRAVVPPAAEARLANIEGRSDSGAGVVSPAVEAVDEGEWEAFQREVASPPPSARLPSALTAEATISAAPVTAAEIAARSREEESRQAREVRETEAEGEREDAALRIEEEFEEQEQLHDRVMRLKRKHEALRQTDEKQTVANAAEAVSSEPKESDTDPTDEEDASEEDDEWAMWPK